MLWGRFGVVLGSFWGRFGVILGSFWGLKRALKAFKGPTPLLLSPCQPLLSPVLGGQRRRRFGRCSESPAGVLMLSGWLRQLAPLKLAAARPPRWSLLRSSACVTVQWRHCAV